MKGIAQSAAQVDHFFDAVERVVGVHQQRCRRIESGKRFERRKLIVVSLDVAVGHRAERRNAVHATGDHKRAARRSGQVRSVKKIITWVTNS